jgi:hypothetical protein
MLLAPIQFTLVVDYFGVQYVGKEHAQHLIDEPETYYTVLKYWNGGLYCSITLKWDYENIHVDLFMPGYIKDDLHKFQHPITKRPKYDPHNFNIPDYGQCIQYAPILDDTPPATLQEITHA